MPDDSENMSFKCMRKLEFHLSFDKSGFQHEIDKSRHCLKSQIQLRCYANFKVHVQNQNLVKDDIYRGNCSINGLRLLYKYKFLLRLIFFIFQLIIMLSTFPISSYYRSS